MKSLDKLRNKVEEDIVAVEDLSDKLSKSIDLHFESRNKKELKRVDGFHPSYTNQCARYWVYLFRGVEVESTFTPQTYRIFDNGHAVHDRIYSYLSGMGILLKEEVPISYDDPPISGTADGVINFHGEKLIELKSISDAGFAYRKTYNKPKDDHIRQAQIYMKCLDLDSGFVIYENKNNQEILPIYMERDDIFIEKLFTKYRKIHKSFIDDVLPVRPYKSIDSKQCVSCNAKDFCWADLDLGKRI
jgi:CRISPR/Cas system-associated exonuclease Cas4 (RecB family)